jgi:hypothetical protein
VGAEDIIGKQLELLTQTVPNVSRVALLRDPTHPCGGYLDPHTPL